MKRKLLFAAALVAGALGFEAQAQSTPTAGVEAAIGDYYIYNLGAGLYLNLGSSYTTHSTVDGAGCVITISGETDAYQLHFAGIDSNSYMGNGGWVDCSTTRDDYSTFAFEPVSVDGYSNVYKIKANNGGSYLYWAGGSGIWGNEAVFGTDNTDAYYWLLIPQATRESTAGASVSNPIDVTYLIKNPDHEQFANVKWSGDYSYQNNGSTGTQANFFERWTGTWNTTAGSGEGGTLYDDDVYQTLASLPAGKYQLSMSAFATQQSDETLEITGVTMYAGEESSVTIGAHQNYTLGFTATGGDVKIGVKIASTNANWVVADKTRLYYLGADLSILIEAYNKAVEAAQAVDQTAKQNAEVLESLQTAIATYGSLDVSTATEESLNEAVTALSIATSNASSSISAYTAVSTILPKMKAETDATNVYTAEAYEEYYGQWAAKYDAGTLTYEEAQALQDPSIVTGWHASVTVDNFLLSAWDTNPDFNDAPYYINTWSTEGDGDGTNFHVPFFEYWTGDANSLGAKTLTATMTGLANGVYEVTAWVRVRAKNGYTAPAYGITLDVNGGQAISATDGAQVGTSQFYIKQIKAVGEVADGTLKINFNVAEDNNISWLSFKNVKYAVATESSVAMNIASGYATFIAPFDVTIPTGVKAYTVDGVEDNGTTLEMTEVTTTIPANTPVVLESESNVSETFAGYSIATEATYTAGLLTGVYAETAAPNGSYVLQNQKDVVGFYQVDTEKAQPKVGANHAYLTYTKPAAAEEGAKAFYFPAGEATAIEAISALTADAIEGIYTIGGAKLNSLQKGINIVKMQNGETQKVLVK